MELPVDLDQQISELMAAKNAKRTTIIRQAIALYCFFDKMKSEGKNIEIVDKKGNRTRFEFIFC
jgi:predicted transcriptional regulator